MAIGIRIRIRKALGIEMSADDVFFWATWIGVLALGIGVMCACAIAISGKIRDDRLTLALSESEARTKEAELKLAQLDKKITPRVISGEQAEEFIEKIKPFPGVSFTIESDPPLNMAL